MILAELMQEISEDRSIHIGVVAPKGRLSELAPIARNLEKYFSDLFPDLQWKIEVHKPIRQGQHPKTTVEMLDWLYSRREAEHWDIAIGAFGLDSRPAKKKQYLVASGVLDTGLVDIFNLNAQELLPEQLQVRIEHGLIIIICHICGLTLKPDSNKPGLRLPNEPEDFDQPCQLSQEQKEVMIDVLAEMSDPRIEELTRDLPRPLFIAQTLWRNRQDIFHNISKGKPWRFPWLVPRLSAAALTSVLFFMLTAESWQLGGNLHWWQVAALMAGSVLGPFLFISSRHNLLFTDYRKNTLSEQQVMAQFGQSFNVFGGFVIVLALLMIISTTGAFVLFPSEVTAAWIAPSDPEIVSWEHTSKFVLFVSSLGLIIGAFGAAFESRDDFRAVILVDLKTP